MKIAVLGSGMVGETLAGGLLALGHEVRMGSRTAEGPAARWASSAGARASAGDFAGAARFGELVINATAGARSLDALGAAGADNLAGKVLLDVSNPINTASGAGPVSLTVANTDSVAEQIQRAFPTARVVKSLNTINCAVMVDPDAVPGDHVVFVSGDDAEAKQTVTELLGSFGWPVERVIDLGALTTARGTEAYLLIWLAMWQAVGHPQFNIAIQRAG
jgi:predicted dinucleotide-binding enzyme